MSTIQSIQSNSTISADYDDFTNTVEIHVGNKTGFRFVNLDRDKAERLVEVINEIKEYIV